MTSAVHQNLVVLKDELAHGKAESKVMPYVARDETVRLRGAGVRDDTSKAQLIWPKKRVGTFNSRAVVSVSVKDDAVRAGASTIICTRLKDRELPVPLAGDQTSDKVNSLRARSCPSSKASNPRRRGRCVGNYLLLV